MFSANHIAKASKLLKWLIMKELYEITAADTRLQMVKSVEITPCTIRSHLLYCSADYIKSPKKYSFTITFLWV